MSQFACRIDSLSPEEQSLRARLFSDLRAAVSAVRRLENGIEAELVPGRIDPAKLQLLISLERRCCEFLSFDVELSSPSPRIRITGDEGVKDFLESEFKLT